MKRRLDEMAPDGAGAPGEIVTTGRSREDRAMAIVGPRPTVTAGL